MSPSDLFDDVSNKVRLIATPCRGRIRLAASLKVDIGKEDESILICRPEKIAMLFQSLKQSGIQTDTNSDVIAIHHRNILLKQVRIMFPFDKEMGMNIYDWKRRSMEVRFWNTQLGFYDSRRSLLLLSVGCPSCNRENQGTEASGGTAYHIHFKVENGLVH